MSTLESSASSPRFASFWQETTATGVFGSSPSSTSSQKRSGRKIAPTRRCTTTPSTISPRRRAEDGQARARPRHFARARHAAEFLFGDPHDERIGIAVFELEAHGGGKRGGTLRLGSRQEKDGRRRFFDGE